MTRGTRLWTVGAVGVVALCWALAGEPATLSASLQSDPSDSARATQVLNGVRGANDIMCELAVRSLGGRFGNWGWSGTAPDATEQHLELLRWATRDTESADAVRILSAALSDRDACVRRVAARLLGRVNHPAAVEALMERLRRGDDHAKQMAAIGLGYAEDTVAVESLIDALKGEATLIRAAAAWALGEIEDERSVEALARAVLEDPDPLVRRQAARALGELY